MKFLDRKDKYFDIPGWYRQNRLSGDIKRDRPYFIYQSWIPEHTNKVIDLIDSPEMPMVDIGMMRGIEDKQTRQDVILFSEKNEDLYRKMCFNLLKKYSKTASGLIVTLDWIPPIRYLVECARILKLPTILIPHESVFANRDMYYTHPRLKYNTPIADLILTWGELQEDIFRERGVCSSKFVRCGTPKLDYISNVEERSFRDAFSLLGLDPDKKTVTFIAQPLDSQFASSRQARNAQEDAVRTILSFIEKRADLQLLVRLPPSRDNVFSTQISQRISDTRNAALDDSKIYLMSPEETVLASDVVVSVNSTMLFEAALCNKPVISAKFIEFEQIWENVNIGVAKCPSQLLGLVKLAINDPQEIVAKYDFAWAKKALSTGEFDGQSASRIKSRLRRLVETGDLFAPA